MTDNPRNFTDELINKLAHDLQGTCQSLPEALRHFGREEDQMTQADHHALDDQVLCCTSCSWWCEPCEMEENDSGEEVCRDCQ